MTLTLALAVLSALLVGLVAGLKVLAPLTKTTADDKALEYAEKAETVVDAVKGYVEPAAK